MFANRNDNLALLPGKIIINKKQISMTRNEIERSLADLNQLVIGGNLMEAFEKYYDDDVVMQENDNTPMVGKPANRQREQDFVKNVVEFSSSVKGSGVGDDLSFVIWEYDFNHREWGVKRYTQVSVQQWKNGKIIREQFFYSN